VWSCLVPFPYRNDSNWQSVTPSRQIDAAMVRFHENTLKSSNPIEFFQKCETVMYWCGVKDVDVSGQRASCGVLSREFWHKEILSNINLLILQVLILQFSGTLGICLLSAKLQLLGYSHLVSLNSVVFLRDSTTAIGWGTSPITNIWRGLEISWSLKVLIVMESLHLWESRLNGLSEMSCATE
jgi:hypothetical protein